MARLVALKEEQVGMKDWVQLGIHLAMVTITTILLTMPKDAVLAEAEAAVRGLVLIPTTIFLVVGAEAVMEIPLFKLG